MIVACVRTGTRYTTDYVYKLKAMVARHLPIEHCFVCLTDRPRDLPGIETVNISAYDLRGWFGKMALFEPSWRMAERVIYLDLDTVVCGDLSHLASLDVEFGICANFTRLAGNDRWPCGYGSCVMTIAPNAMSYVWERFEDDRTAWLNLASNYGDQLIIERLAPGATLLQEVMPQNFFLGYRDLTHIKPQGCSIVVFAGRSKPHNCNEQWIKTAWT